MSSLKQIEANRLNAATKSTGPRTDAGKSVIPGEDPAHFDALRTSHYDQFQPAPHEHVLLAAMVRDAWRLERSANAETSIWTRAMEGNRGQAHPSAARHGTAASGISAETVPQPIAQPESPEPLGVQIGSVPTTTQPSDPLARPRVTFPILGRKTVPEPPPTAL